MTFNLAGVKIGHATNEELHTGCTVLLLPEGAIGSVDVRGPAPGSREAALLGLDKPIETLNAIVLTGGSAFGLATADGVVRYLAGQGIGHWTPIKRVPIVAGAVVYDLFFGQGQQPPDAAMGYAACLDAREDNFGQGNVGAGAGVTVGKWAGFDSPMKGGFGLASVELGELVVTAVAVTNAIGDIVNPDGSVLAGARNPQGGWMAEQHPYRFISERRMPLSGTSTTLVAVITNAILSKNEANMLAQRAHDGMAIAIRPAHTRHDGDTAYAVSTQQVKAEYNLVANVAVDMVAEAIRNSVRQAETVGSIVGLQSEA